MRNILFKANWTNFEVICFIAIFWGFLNHVESSFINSLIAILLWTIVVVINNLIKSR
jgi:hypothetical protein